LYADMVAKKQALEDRLRKKREARDRLRVRASL
jgi:hypothetical protein